jgi:probable HAF family extracellular repeat protein
MNSLKSYAHSFREALRRWRITMAAALFLAFSATTGVSAAAQVAYTVIDLGTLGGTFGLAHGINNHGQVNGFANLTRDRAHHAFFWQNGVKTDIGTFGGPNSDSSFGPSERGQVAGSAEYATRDPLKEDYCANGTFLTCRAYLWQNGVKTDLGTLGGNNSYANGINNLGQVAGSAEISTPDPTCPRHFVSGPLRVSPAVLWENGKIQELPLFPGDTEALALSINDNGQAVGVSGNCSVFFGGPSHALLWENGVFTDLGNLGGMINWALNINNQGQVVGYSDLADNTTQHAFLWQNGVMTDLGTLPGDVGSFAGGINNNGQAVGGSFDAFGNERAFLWQNGIMTDLNTLIPFGSPLYLLFAPDINAVGQIVGAGFQLSGCFCEIHAFLLNPVSGSTPSTSAASSTPARVTLPEDVRNKLRELVRPGRGALRIGKTLPN